MMQFTAKQIADFIGGRVEGNENATVSTFAKIEEGKEGAITFLSNPKYTPYIYERGRSTGEARQRYAHSCEERL